MCGGGGGGGGNIVTKSVNSVKKRVEGVGEGFKKIGDGNIKGGIEKLGEQAIKINSFAGAPGFLNEGLKLGKDMKDAQKEAIGSAKEGAEAAKEQLEVQKKQIDDVRKEKQDEMKTKEQQDAAEAAGSRRDTARRRQRTRALGASGRRSTILTSGVDNNTQGTRKTLLGQ